MSARDPPNLLFVPSPQLSTRGAGVERAQQKFGWVGHNVLNPNLSPSPRIIPKWRHLMAADPNKTELDGG